MNTESTPGVENLSRRDDSHVAAVSTSSEVKGRGLSYKWLVALTVVFGIFMNQLDISVVNVALAKLQVVFTAPLNTLQWIITAYLLAMGVSIPLGGYLVQYVGWHFIFFINVPIGFAGFLMAWFILRERRLPQPPGLDWRGIVLSAIGFVSLLYGISEAATVGWSAALVLIPIIVGLLSLLALVVVELRTASPALDVRLFKDGRFTDGNLVAWILQFSFFGSFFLIPLYLQELRGVSPLQAGLWLVSVALSAAVVLPISGMLVDRFGAKWVIVFGVIALTFSSW